MPQDEPKSGFSRRDFLVGALATGTLATIGTYFTPGGSTPGEVTINFATGAEPSGALDLLVNLWNQANPRARVTVVPAGDESTSDQRDAMIGMVANRAADVLNLDVINVPYFARNGFLAPVEITDAQEFLPATLAPGRLPAPGGQAASSPAAQKTYWAAPFNADAGMLFERLRSDVPPKDGTPELTVVLDRLVADGSGQFVGQLNPRVSTAREPFVVNMLEHAVSRDPEILDGETGMPALAVGRWQAALEPLRRAVAAGRVARADTESATRDMFSRDKLSYMRNWPAEFRRLQQQNGDRDSQTLRVRVGVLPTGILGGGSLAVPSNARQPARAADFIRFLTSREAQRIITSYGLAPARRAVYEDKSLLPFIPHLLKVREAVENARPRPIAVGYPEFSTAVVRHFREFLTGTDLSAAFVDDMQQALAPKPGTGSIAPT